MTDQERISSLIGQGEGLRVEFKEAQTDVPKSLFDTICAFLNREGGTVLLGVRDNGTLVGVDQASVSKLCKNIVTSANDPDKLTPICRLFPEVIPVDGQTVILIAVPQSSQVHRANRTIYDRSADGDFRVTDQEATRMLYDRKANVSTENRVLPYLELADLRPDLFSRVRQLATVRQDGQHSWNRLNDKELLLSAGLWRRDFQAGQEGYTLAACLLFGKNETIRSALPYYEFDALVRQINTDRYDDRDYVQGNLFEVYDRLIAFVRKHLADPFFLEDMQRVSLRDRIFREVIVNMLAHREYSSGYPARLIIYSDHVLTENASRTYQSGPLDPEHFVPYPKNPAIASMFREVGLMDQLGSGVRRVTQYQPAYTPGRSAEFLEGDVFRTVIPIPVYRDFQAERKQVLKPVGEASTDIINATINDHLTLDATINATINDLIPATINLATRSRISAMLFQMAVAEGITNQQLQQEFKVSRYTILRDMQLLRDAGLVEFSGAKKNGRYTLTDEARTRVRASPPVEQTANTIQ